MQRVGRGKRRRRFGWQSAIVFLFLLVFSVAWFSWSPIELALWLASVAQREQLWPQTFKNCARFGAFSAWKESGGSTWEVPQNKRERFPKLDLGHKMWALNLPFPADTAQVLSLEDSSFATNKFIFNSCKVRLFLLEKALNKNHLPKSLLYRDKKGSPQKACKQIVWEEQK